MRIVNVQLGERAYPIYIGAAACDQLANVIRELPGVSRVALIVDERVAGLHLDRALQHLKLPVETLTFPPGEQSKTLRQAESLYDGLARARIGRRDLVITLGGGVAGDLGGFVAATWLRGVRFVQMPTTLQAAIDASIGGKTAVNHPTGKNLIGVFHQPAAVIVDIGFLETLPQRDYVAGLGESVKHAVIRDAEFLEWHEREAEKITGRAPDVLEELIARNCEIKADVVARDEREADLRMILNYGHTLGHAIEHVLGYELRHGECVALGSLAENELARARGLLPGAVAERIRDVIRRLGLPERLPRPLAPADVIAACQMDKKVRGGAVQFVLPQDLGVPTCVTDVTDDEIVAALGAIQPS